MTRIRVLIADDHAILRAGLRMLLDAQPDFEVVGEAADGAGTLHAATAARPDVVLLDFTMPASRGTRTIEQLTQLDPRPRVLVLTMHDDPAYAQAALAAGADGYIVKKAADIELLTALRAVYHGRTVMDVTQGGSPGAGDDAGSAGHTPAPGRPKKLSRREAEVIRLLAEGLTNQAVAERLEVSTKTVETYRKRLTDKLGLKGRAELYRFALESGLLGDDSDA